MTKAQLQSGSPGRNDACPCGSQKKYQKCCGNAAATLPVTIEQTASTIPFSILWDAATQAFEAGDLAQAQANCEQALQLDPQHADSLQLRSMIALRQGDCPTALDYIYRALEQAPQASIFYNSLGTIQQALGQTGEAEKAYRMALQLDPDSAMVHFNLGDLWHAQEKNAEAELCYREALRCQPSFPEAHNNLGLLMSNLQRPDQAITHFVEAINLRPDYLKAHYSLACVLREQGRFADAQTVLERALKLKPDFAEAWHDLGLSLLCQEKPLDALDALERSAQLNPNLDRAYLNIGNIHYERGLVDVSRRYFERAQAVRPSDATRLKIALSFPAIYDSVEQVKIEHDRLITSLAQLATENLQIRDPHEEVVTMPFYLAYQGENELDTLSRIGDLFLQVCPALGTTAPHCLTPKPHGGRLKIGFLSSSFTRQNHVVNRVMGPVIANWPRDSYELTLLYRHMPCGEIVQYMHEGDRLIRVPNALAAARQQIADQQLDILFFCDIGLEPWSYFLSFARLAPLQVTSGGHPITSGIPNLDYFISSANDEVAHAQQHYRERIVLMPQRTVCYYPAASPTQVKTRADLGLPENKHIYLCPMTPFKLHPEMDHLIGEILRTDPEGEVVFVTNYQTELWERLKQRFARTLPDVFARIRFLPFMPMHDFVELLRLSDVMLDTTKFNGGTTSLEALAVGTPIVTLPGELLRQRCTFAMYNAMDWRECVAKDAQDYVRLATEIARRPEYRAHLKQEILARKAILFGQKDWIKPLSDFLLNAMEDLAK